MKKKSFGLAAAVAVLIVLGGSYALLANHNRIQESESAAAESETGVAVATIASDKVSSFQLADGDTSFTLTKTDNSWICVQDETFPLSNDAASELVNTFTLIANSCALVTVLLDAFIFSSSRFACSLLILASALLRCAALRRF